MRGIRARNAATRRAAGDGVGVGGALRCEQRVLARRVGGNVGNNLTMLRTC
jgi:hypothetical protein